MTVTWYSSSSSGVPFGARGAKGGENTGATIFTSGK
jgi:hypothetical protein